MTKANANAAANAQEQQASQQQILRDLLALGKKNGRLTLKEISDALSHLELSSEDIDKVYETLETMGIEVETNGVLEKVIGDDDDSFEPEEVEEVFTKQFDVDFIHVHAEERYLELLRGVTDPEQKRRIIGRRSARSICCPLRRR